MRFMRRLPFPASVACGVLSVTVALLGGTPWNFGATKAVAQLQDDAKTLLGTIELSKSKPDFDVMQNVVATGEFKTLITLLTAADLTSELKGPVDRTLFAPNDTAFEKLPKGTVERLLRPENKQELVRLLKNHVANNMTVTAEDMEKGIGPTIQMTMGKDSILLEKRRNQLTADRVNIIKTDIRCSNGVIHVIDGILSPR